MKDSFWGTLSDNIIKEYCENKILISDNYDERNIKQACYELRASNIYYDISNSAKKYELSEGEYILIKPKQIAVVITKEYLNLPNDILGRILSKGSLFSIGILPVNTYADPGFSGNLGIVINNLSNNYIKIKPSEHIAKIEFTKLQESVLIPYNGQHGFQTNIWPIRNDLILTEEEIKNDKRILNQPMEVELSYGKSISSVLQRIFKYERLLIGSTVVYLLFSMLLITLMIMKDADGNQVMSPIISVLIGVGSNILFGLISFLATNMEKRGK